MNHKNHGLAPLEHRYRWEKTRRLAVLGLGALALTGASPSSSSEAQPNTQPMIIGVVEDEILSKDFEVSKTIAERIKELGVDEVFVKEPWTYPRQCAEIKNDLEAFQNAVRAADEADLGFGLNLLPRSTKGIGYAPTTATEQRCFVDTLVAYEHAFAEVNPGGHLTIELPNEPNSKTWWKKQEDSLGNWIAPQAVGRLLARASRMINPEAEKLDITVDLEGPGLASNHDPGAFLEELGDSTSGLESDVSAISIHPYGAVNNEPPTVEHPESKVIGVADYDYLMSTLKKHMGAKMAISYTEYGVKTKVPADKQNLYSVLPTSDKLVSESQQADFYSNFIKLARCQKMVKRILFFNIIDDSDGVWTSGLMYPDYSPKSSYERVKQTIADEKAGNIICSDRP